MNVLPFPKPRTLAHVLLDLKEARQDWQQAVDEIARLPICDPAADDLDDRASEADRRTDALREEFAERFENATGLTWAQIEAAIQECVL